MQSADVFAKDVRRGADQGFELVDGLRACLHHTASGDPQGPDHLDSAVTGLRGRCRGPGLYCPCVGLSIDDIALAATAACLTVGAVELDDTVAVVSQPPGQAGTAAAVPSKPTCSTVPIQVAHASKDA
ncbi:hypothetical protein [Streptomyces luteogriseus]|uniref:hypothetical protein n=1 Tax=Streptomyces luteogriseus TaxID=68233 RepID=UPI003830816C